MIADVSESNANVFYEVGLAEALGKPIIFLRDKAESEPEDMPFDTRAYEHIFYEYGFFEEAQKELSEYIATLEYVQ